MNPGFDGLAAVGLTVHFGGSVALDDLSFEVPLGRMTGLIGPNGAGKTTTFNACSGTLRPRSGRVCLFGRDVTSSSPAARARRGMGRTFQRMELFDSLTVIENVALGREAGLAGANPVRQVFSSRHDRQLVGRAAGDAIALCGLGGLTDHPVGGLSTGQRRLVELARVLAGDFRLLLLDEPSSGLDKAETERFGAVLRRVVDERGWGIFIVEHDMDLVMRTCDFIYVLDFGKLIFEGTAPETRLSPVVRAAYLGDEVGADV